MGWDGWFKSIRSLGDVSKVLPANEQGLIWNSTTLQYEPANLASGLTFGQEKFTATAGQTVFTLSATFATGSCRVFRNGILQEKDVDYTETASRTSITFAVGLDLDEKVEVQYVAE